MSNFNTTEVQLNRRRSIIIVNEEWPEVAYATTNFWIKIEGSMIYNRIFIWVLQHKKGMHIVRGSYSKGTNFDRDTTPFVEGFFEESGFNIGNSIYRVGEFILERAKLEIGASLALKKAVECVCYDALNKLEPLDPVHLFLKPDRYT